MSTEPLYVTRKGLDLLDARIASAKDDLRNVQGQKGEAAEVGGNAWHDNFAFEDLVRQETMLNKRLDDLIETRGRIQVVEPAALMNDLQIGNVATLQDADGNERVFEVGGFGETDLEAFPPVIDYTAPLIRAFVGHECGHEAAVTLQGQTRAYTLVKIDRKEA